MADACRTHRWIRCIARRSQRGVRAHGGAADAERLEQLGTEWPHVSEGGATAAPLGEGAAEDEPRHRVHE
jgi:hypothetical protein